MLNNYLSFIKVALVVGLLYFVYDFVSNSFEKTRTIETLNSQLSMKEETIKSLQFSIKTYEENLKVALDVQKAKELRNEMYKSILTEHNGEYNEIPDDIRSTIDALDRLLGE